MSKRRSSGAVSAVAEGLGVHLTQFLATLAAAGYAKKTQHDKRRAIVRFARWTQDARLTLADLDEACVGAFLARSSCPRWKCREPERAALRSFLEYLRALGVASQSRPSEPVPAEMLVRRYLDHLRGVRGLCTRSVEVYSPFVRAFIAAQRLPEHVASLDASDIRAHLLDRSRNRSTSFVRLLTAALRSFLRFMFLDGLTAADLSTAVPPVRRWRLAAVPPFLTPEEAERVIAATDRSTARGRRAAAMLLLLARLGLRAGEVVALELDDIRWDSGEIVVRGKGRLHDRLPLLADVGEALALYLREARGRSASRRVFLRRIAPRVGLSGPSAVSAVVRDALRRAGLRPAGRVGAHIFRHSLATRMIRRGASLGEISQVLRHRSIGTTQLYAKVEFEALRGVALPWPTAEVHP
jgi:site-specific recombinase XerD